MAWVAIAIAFSMSDRGAHVSTKEPGLDGEPLTGDGIGRGWAN